MKLWNGRYRYLSLFHISEAFWRALVLSVATGVEYHAEILMNMVNAIIRHIQERYHYAVSHSLLLQTTATGSKVPYMRVLG